MRFIFYDTETTGTRPEHDRVVEIAAFDPERNQTFAKLVNPGIPIPVEATAIHKISDKMVCDAPSFSLVAAEFIQFCDGEVILVAHNNDAFDLQFLKSEFSRCGAVMPPWAFLDSLKWARRYRPDLPRHSLQYLREIYGIKANNAHRALDDVIVLHQVFHQMIDDLSPKVTLSLLSKKRPMRTMPFGKYLGTPLAKLPSDYIKWLAGSGALDKEENLELKQSLVQLGVL